MFDRPLDESRHVALDLIASGSSVLDIGGVLRDSGLPLEVEHRAVFSHPCREVVVVRLAR